MPPKNSHHWVIPVVCFAIVAALVVLGLKSAKKPPAPVSQDVPVETMQWPSEQLRKETMTDTTKGFDITATYPVAKGETITHLFEDFVTDQIDTFKADIIAAGELPEGFRDMTLDITYTEERVKVADTYVFTIYSDTGGAHGLTATKTFSFNNVGEQITIADLFTTGTRGLGTVADYVKKELMKREFADSNWISEGAAPTEENYQNFIVTDTGVTSIFDPYQVAAYAAGVIRVDVPVSVFKSIANPELFTSR